MWLKDSPAVIIAKERIAWELNTRRTPIQDRILQFQFGKMVHRIQNSANEVKNAAV